MFFYKSEVSSDIGYNFPETIYLEGHTVPLDTALFRYPWRIRAKGNRIVVEDLHGTDYFFHLFTYPEFHYLSSFAKRGDGPTEMLQTENFRWIGDCLWTLDSSKAELTCWKFNEKADSLIRGESIRLDKALLRPLDFVSISDTSFIIPDYSGVNRFCWVDSRGKMFRKTGNIPATDSEIPSTVLAQAWRNFIDYNPHNDVLVSVTQLGDILEIYHLKQDDFRIKVGNKGEPRFDVSNEGYAIPVGHMGFGDVQVSNSAIYTTFEGTSFKEISTAYQKGDNLITGGKHIYVYTLQGEPLREYILSSHIDGLFVDEERNMIWGINGNQDEPIVRFDL
ncbi:MAG: BF3164 family lipoprotein [Bacteroides sp.]